MNNDAFDFDTLLKVAGGGLIFVAVLMAAVGIYVPEKRVTDFIIAGVSLLLAVIFLVLRKQYKK